MRSRSPCAHGRHDSAGRQRRGAPAWGARRAGRDTGRRRPPGRPPRSPRLALPARSTRGNARARCEQGVGDEQRQGQPARGGDRRCRRPPVTWHPDHGPSRFGGDTHRGPIRAHAQALDRVGERRARPRPRAPMRCRGKEAGYVHRADHPQRGRRHERHQRSPQHRRGGDLLGASDRAPPAPGPHPREHRRQRRPCADGRAERRERQRPPRPLPPGDAALVGRRRHQPGERQREPSSRRPPREAGADPSASRPRRTWSPGPAGGVAWGAEDSRPRGRPRNGWPFGFPPSTGKTGADGVLCSVYAPGTGPRGPEMVRRRSTAACAAGPSASAPIQETLARQRSSPCAKPHECRPCAGGGTSCKVPMAPVREGSVVAARRIAVRGPYQPVPSPVRARTLRPRDEPFRWACQSPAPFRGVHRGRGEKAKARDGRPGWTNAPPGPSVSISGWAEARAAGGASTKASPSRSAVGAIESLTAGKVGGSSKPAAAGLAQLVERQLPKLKVTGSRPVSRSIDRRGFGSNRRLGFCVAPEGTGDQERRERLGSPGKASSTWPSPRLDAQGCSGARRDLEGAPGRGCALDDRRRPGEVALARRLQPTLTAARCGSGAQKRRVARRALGAHRVAEGVARPKKPGARRTSVTWRHRTITETDVGKDVAFNLYDAWKLHPDMLDSCRPGCPEAKHQGHGRGPQRTGPREPSCHRLRLDEASTSRLNQPLRAG